MRTPPLCLLLNTTHFHTWNINNKPTNMFPSTLTQLYYPLSQHRKLRFRDCDGSNEAHRSKKRWCWGLELGVPDPQHRLPEASLFRFCPTTISKDPFPPTVPLPLPSQQLPWRCYLKEQAMFLEQETSCRYSALAFLWASFFFPWNTDIQILSLTFLKHYPLCKAFHDYPP